MRIHTENSRCLTHKKVEIAGLRIINHQVRGRHMKHKALKSLITETALGIDQHHERQYEETYFSPSI